MSKAPKRGAYREHVAAVKDLDRAGVLFVCGSSEFLLNRTMDRIRAGASQAGLPYAAVEAQAVNEALIMQIGSQGSLFEPASLYVFRRVEQARALPKLLKALPSGDLANRLVLVYRGESAPAPLKTELTRLKARQIPCFEPWPNEIPDVVASLAQDAGLRLGRDAVQLLLEMNGTDLVTHHHEITKLSLIFAKAEAPLNRADLAPHLGLLREDDAYQLDKLLLQRHWARAQALTAHLIQRGEKGVALLGIVSSHCRNMLKIADAQARGLSRADFEAEARIAPFILKSYMQGLDGQTRAEPRRYLKALHLCCETDALLKSSGIQEDLLLARVIDELATP